MSVYFLYVLSALNGIAVQATQIVLALYALNHGAKPYAVGLLASTFCVFPMLLGVTAGRLVDRFGARWPMMLGAGCGGLGLLVAYLLPGLPAVYLAAAMMGLATLFVSLPTQNLVGLLSTPENRPRNFANYMLGNSLASLVGPLIGGFSIEHWGHAQTCLHLALLTLVPVAMLAVRGGTMPGGTRHVEKSEGGTLHMLADPAVRRTLVSGSLVNVGINLFQWYMPVYAHSINVSASGIGMIMATNSAAAFVVRFGLPNLIRKFGESGLLAYAFFVGAMGLALVPLFHNALALGVVAFGFGLGMGAGQPIIIMLMYCSSPAGRSGEALGLKIMTNQLTKLISPVVFGAIASGFGLGVMFWINAAMLAGGGWVSRSAPQPQEAESAGRAGG